MKETKSFFTNNNRLNKGYPKPYNMRESDNNFYRKKFEHILPPIDLMAEYENIHPGTLEKLLNMAQKEQVHKHDLDLKNLKIHEKIAKLTRVCLLIFGIFLMSAVISLTIYEGIIAGITMLCFIIYFVLIFLKKIPRKNEYIKK